MNIGFYGSYNHFVGDPHPEKSDYWSDAVSFNRQLDESHFNSSHTYRLEWDVPTDKKDGYLHWFLDGKLVLAINGTGIRNGGTGKRSHCLTSGFLGFGCLTETLRFHQDPKFPQSQATFF